MGHDYLSFNGRSVHLLDTQIELLRHFCTQVANELRPADLKADEQTIDSLGAFVAAWQRAGPGVWINTDFSEFVKVNPHRREVLLKLFARVADHLNCEDGDFVAARSTILLNEALQGLSKLLQD